MGFSNTREIYEMICAEIGKDPDSGANGHCPAHQDDQGSLSVTISDKGKVLIKCFAGCETASILSELGLEMSDLFPVDAWARKEKTKSKRVKSDLTVAKLAEAKRIPVEKLVKWGCSDETDDYYGRYVRIQYFDFDGRARPSYRRRLAAKGGSSNWGPKQKGNKPSLYGEQFMERIRELRWCVFVEGESDCWSLWLHKYPALGIPGASSAKLIKGEHIEGLTAIWVFIEPDQGGATMADKIPKRLAELGYKGELYRIFLPDHKDPNDLHQRSPTDEDFRRVFQSVIDLRKPLMVPGASKGRFDRCTDLSNAERLASQFGEDISYCAEWHRWMIWDGRRWANDRTLEIKRMATQTVRAIYDEAKEADDADQRKRLVKHAIESENERRITAMISLCQVQAGVPVLPEFLDSDPWLLNVNNGTVDLRTGKLRSSRREDRISKCAPVDYDSKAKCKTFLKFLDQIFEGNQDLIDFIRRSIGYSLTGVVTERCLWILHGVGKNGKSTLLEVVAALLGDYSMRTPTDTLMVQYGGGSGIPNDIARLKGARFVSASESEEGQRLAESKIKDLTGGDTVSARFMRGEFFDFKPEFKLWLATNHKPIIRGTDNAIWDRIKLVPFKFRVEQPDPSLPKKLESELPGILQWAIAGCLDWQQNGLGEPEEVGRAVEDYRSDMDLLGDFLFDCTSELPVSGAGSGPVEVANADLFKEYRRYCEQNAIKMMNQKRFSMRLVERGYTQRRNGKGRIWIGLRIIEDWERESVGSDNVSDRVGDSDIDSHAPTREGSTSKTRHNPTPDTDAASNGGGASLGDYL